MITLYQYSPIWGLPNASPFCMKLETYLRMTALPFETKYVNNPRKSPRGKLPYIKDGEQIISDTGLIIDYLKKKYGDKLDNNLTPEQNAQRLTTQRLLEEHLYWALLYSRWTDPNGWDAVKAAFFAKLPKYLWFVPNQARKYMQQQIYHQGMGRHSAAEVYQLGNDDITAVSAALGNKKYFFGENPTSIDASLYAFMANILYTPFANPLKTHAQSLPNLVPYCVRMQEKYYP